MAKAEPAEHGGREVTGKKGNVKPRATIDERRTISGYEDYPDPIRITAPPGYHLKIFISSRSHVCLVSLEAD